MRDHVDREMEWFEAHREELLEEHRGEWAVVHDQQLIGTYPSFGEALKKGIELTDSEEILVQPILESDEPLDLSMIQANVQPTAA